VSLTQLEYFVAVAEEGSVSRAARRCAISQPPLTRHVRALEAELDARLFWRRPHGMELTEEGSRLLEHAREVLAMVRSPRAVVRRCNSMK